MTAPKIARTDKPSMLLNGKRILIISPQPWAGLQMSKHHLAIALAARGNYVVFLDPPQKEVQGVSVRQEGKVAVATYRHWLRGVNKLPMILHRWYYRRTLSQLTKATGGPFDILWCFDTSRMKWFPKGMGYPLLHLADIDIVQQGKGLLEGASLVLAVSAAIQTKALAHKPQAPVIDVGHALDQRWLDFPKQDRGNGNDSPRIVAYAGQMQWNYVDWTALFSIATGHAKMEFHFYGPYHEDHIHPAFPAVFDLPNTYFHGRVDKSELIPALHAADILLLSYRDDLSEDQCSNSHKILEYLSTGNVVVSSHISAYRKRDDVLLMAPKGSNIVTVFENAVEEYGALNHQTKRLERRAFAAQHSFPHFLKRVENLLGNG